MTDILDWERILLDDKPTIFLLEVILRSVIMFVIITITLRASGKRGIRQLSIFELVLIIGLGSAAGDPMFYEDVSILPALTVFIVIILLYIGITKLTDKFRWFEVVLEGKPLYVIKEGSLIMESFKESGLSKDEFFSELRQKNVEHLGQVRTALIETSGEISILFYPDEEVKPGLPIFPYELSGAIKHIPLSGLFCCSKCGQLKTLPAGANLCSGCTCEEWVVPSQAKRIS